ncbi:MAG: hypothetical protein ACW9W4_05685 [Candidatus Nitrosopumilus sp. bin_7KS]
MDLPKTIVSLIIIGLVIFVGIFVFKEMAVTLWNLSPLTSVGFVASIGIAIWKGRLGLDQGEENIRILGLIFVGTIISYAATSQLPNLWNNVVAGNLVGAAVIAIVILILFFKGQEIKNS